MEIYILSQFLIYIGTALFVGVPLGLVFYGVTCLLLRCWRTFVRLEAFLMYEEQLRREESEETTEHPAC